MKLHLVNSCKWICISVVIAAFATARGLCETPEAVVKRYCSLDARGANVNASNPDAKAALDLLINEDEAGYDESVIIKSYRVGKPQIRAKKAEIDVIYSSLGTVGGELSTQKDPHLETVTFHLTLVGNLWKIDGLRIRPHISQSWMLAHLRRNRSDDQQERKSDPKLEAAIAEIGRW
jgi:hypothetical protein